MIALFAALTLLLPEKIPFRYETDLRQGDYLVKQSLYTENREISLSSFQTVNPTLISAEELLDEMLSRLPRESRYRLIQEKPLIAEWISEKSWQIVRIDTHQKELSLLTISAPEEPPSNLKASFQKIIEDAKVTHE